jgi:Tfp pilus assembly protein PilN
MIEINLLPPDRRPIERTPLPRFVALLVGILVIGAELFYAFLFHAIRIPNDKEALGQLKVNAERKKTDAAQADKYQKAIDDLNVRTKAVVDLIRNRNKTWVWTPVLDHLDEPSVLPDEVWLTKLDVKPPAGKSPGSATIIGFVRGGVHERIDKFAEFVGNLRTDEVIEKRFNVQLKAVQTVELPKPPKDYRSARVLPREALAFELLLEVRGAPQPKQPTRKRGKK